MGASATSARHTRGELRERYRGSHERSGEGDEPPSAEPYCRLNAEAFGPVLPEDLTIPDCELPDVLSYALRVQITLLVPAEILKLIDDRGQNGQTNCRLSLIVCETCV